MASTHDESVTTIIKSDRIGRPHYSKEFKAEVLAGYDASGMGAPAFAERCGVKYPTFAGWLAKRRRENTAPPAAAQSFIIAELAEGSPGDAVRVTLPGGAAAQFTDPSQAPLIAALIKALA